MKKQEDKTKNGYENRPQLGSGPTYSDSPSDNANSSITSSPTDTLRTSKNSAAKIIKNLSPIKAKIKKFKNGDYNVDYSSGWNGALLGIRKILQLSYRGASNYANYDTSKGVLSLRLSGHNANGNNFSHENINISIYVALFEYEHIETSIKYTEFRITEKTYNTNPQKVVFEIVTAVERALNGDLFELDNDIAEKTSYNFETEIPNKP
jgi:hypothetical protein